MGPAVTERDTNVNAQTPPPIAPPPVQPFGKGLEHLNLLGVFHYVLGGIVGFFACMPLIHVGVGVFLLSQPHGFGGPNDIPPFMGWMFVILGTTFVVLGWTLAGMLLAAGSRLRRRRKRIFCIVVAALSCAFTPLGTVLGVFTLIELFKPEVKTLFETGATPHPPAGGG